MTREVVARNFATDSENRIHADDVALRYGLRGGLVPGVTLYGYMVSGDVLRRGPFRVRFVKPVYDGDRLIVCEEAASITLQRDGEICSIVTFDCDDLRFPAIAARPLPLREARPDAGPDSLIPSTVLGTVECVLMSEPAAENVPASLLSLANRALMDNFRLGPWMHVASEVSPRGPIRFGDPVSVYSRVHDCYAKKGRDFVVVDVNVECGGRPVQAIRHTAMYRV